MVVLLGSADAAVVATRLPGALAVFAAASSPVAALLWGGTGFLDAIGELDLGLKAGKHAVEALNEGVDPEVPPLAVVALIQRYTRYNGAIMA